jgi:hypothetical protein
MNGFEKRITKARELEIRFTEFLNSKGISYVQTGYENFKEYRNALPKIAYLSDATSKFLRFIPDFALIRKDSTVMIEVKNSTGIEKECYDSYKILSDKLGVRIFILNKFSRLMDLHDIKFQKTSSYDYIAKMDIPVVDDIWKSPRELPKEQYYDYLKAYEMQNKFTSGCSFAFIDFETTKSYSMELIEP